MTGVQQKRAVRLDREGVSHLGGGRGLEGADRRRWTSGVRMRPIQHGNSIRSRHVRDDKVRKPARTSAACHSAGGVIAHVRGVAQQLDGLQMRVEHRGRPGEQTSMNTAGARSAARAAPGAGPRPGRSSGAQRNGWRRSRRRRRRTASFPPPSPRSRDWRVHGRALPRPRPPASAGTGRRRSPGGRAPPAGRRRGRRRPPRSSAWAGAMRRAMSDSASRSAPWAWTALST